MRKHYSAEFKAKVVREVLREEKTLGEIASQYGEHPNQVRQWRDKIIAARLDIFARQSEAKAVEQPAAPSTPDLSPPAMEHDGGLPESYLGH